MPRRTKNTRLTGTGTMQREMMTTRTMMQKALMPQRRLVCLHDLALRGFDFFRYISCNFGSCDQCFPLTLQQLCNIHPLLATKKKKKKSNKKKKKVAQTEPPTIPMSKMFGNKIYPEGELCEYKEEYVTLTTDFAQSTLEKKE